MRLFIPIGIVALLMSGCGPARVVYAKYGRLKLSDNEVNHYPVGGADVLKFQDCCAIETDAVFLNRTIVNAADGYDIYISVSETLLQGDFEQAQASDKAVTVLANSTCLINKVKVNAYLLQKGAMFVARFTYVETRSGLLVIYDICSKSRAMTEEIIRQKETYLDEKIRL